MDAVIMGEALLLESFENLFVQSETFASYNDVTHEIKITHVEKALEDPDIDNNAFYWAQRGYYASNEQCEQSSSTENLTGCDEPDVIEILAERIAKNDYNVLTTIECLADLKCQLKLQSAHIFEGEMPPEYKKNKITLPVTYKELVNTIVETVKSHPNCYGLVINKDRNADCWMWHLHKEKEDIQRDEIDGPAFETLLQLGGTIAGVIATLLIKTISKQLKKINFEKDSHRDKESDDPWRKCVKRAHWKAFDRKKYLKDAK